MADDKKPEHQAFAEKVLAKLPKAVRDEAEAVPGGGAYSLLKVGGRTVASIRGNSARVTFRHDGGAEAAARFASLTADAVASTPPKADAE
jgi:hypothetical protein